MDVAIPELERIAAELRLELVATSHRCGTAHLASGLSVVDILVAAYWTALRVDASAPAEPNRDRLIFSKGHAIAALYAVLARRGFIAADAMRGYNEPGGDLPEQPSPGCVPGVEAATGSLGHGLGLGIGMALAGRIRGDDFRVFTVLSDGECNEGSVWEAAMFAPRHGLANVLAIVDFNKWQGTGRSEEILALQPFREKWAAFGWDAHEIDGHCMQALVDAFAAFPAASGRPTAIIANTVKGKGVSFMEDDNNWHYRIPTADEVVDARRQLLGDEVGRA
jgi:transketolase